MTAYLWGKLFGSLFVFSIGVLLILRGIKFKKEPNKKFKTVIYLGLGFLLAVFQLYNALILLYQTQGIPGSEAWVPDTRKGYVDSCLKENEIDRESCVCLQESLEERITKSEFMKIVEGGLVVKWQTAYEDSLSSCGLSSE